MFHVCRDSFRFYVAQDAHFLAAFLAAYEAAAKLATAQQQLEHVAVLQRLQQGIKEELLLHASYAAVWLLQQCSLQEPDFSQWWTEVLVTAIAIGCLRGDLSWFC